ncbi:MAG: hypothetical protein K2N27_04250 [Ruminococcus sp.]|nr:hypothetical protein [Ruminococcus sp.]
MQLYFFSIIQKNARRNSRHTDLINIYLLTDNKADALPSENMDYSESPTTE